MNKAPLAVMRIEANGSVIPENGDVASGATVKFSAENSQDYNPGYISEYRWDFGDGKGISGKNANYAYVNPGTYEVKLTVTDNLGAKSSAVQTVNVRDTRPDLYIESLTWTPDEPQENDVINIRATIGNKGKGSSMMGFLVGFYIDNKYIGYSKVADNVIIPVGGTVEVTYTALVGGAPKIGRASCRERV